MKLPHVMWFEDFGAHGSWLNDHGGLRYVIGEWLRRPEWYTFSSARLER